MCGQRTCGVLRGAALLVVVAACSSAPPPPPASRSLAAVAPKDPLATCAVPRDLGRDPVARRSQVEPWLASQPGAGRTLLAAWQQDRLRDAGALGIVAAVSHDAGASWSPSALPALTRCTRGPFDYASDPEAGIGPDGTLYVSAIAVGPPGQAIVVSTSGDGGRSWNGPRVVSKEDGYNAILDKPALLVNSTRPDTAYVVWVAYPDPHGASVASLRVDAAWLSLTTDRGRTWSRPERIYGADTENQGHVLVELGRGVLLDAFAEAYQLAPTRVPHPERIRVMSSTDGGRTWTTPLTVATIPYTVAEVPLKGPAIRSSSEVIAAGPAPAGGAAAAWEINENGRSAIGAAISDSRTSPWRRLPDLITGNVAAFDPEIGVGHNGTVVVTWYAASAGAGDPTYLEASVLQHGGRTWETRVLTGPFRLADAPNTGYGLFLGDYEGMTGFACGFQTLDSVIDSSGAATAETGYIAASC